MNATIYKNANLLFPPLADKMFSLIEKCKQIDISIDVFETYRSPTRQTELYNKVPSVTHAIAWESWHQYGLAFDVAFFDGKNWSWDGDWFSVGKIGVSLGMRWGGEWTVKKVDKPHFENQVYGLTIEDAKTITSTEGLLSLWAEIEKRSKT